MNEKTNRSERLVDWMFATMPVRWLALLAWIATCFSGSIVTATASMDHAPTTVTEEGVFISLPVFIACIIATAIFTTAVMKYDNGRLKRVDELERKIESLLRERHPERQE